MIAVFVNMGTVFFGSLIGIIFREKIKKEFTDAAFSAIALITLVIGVSGAIKTKDVICLIICTVLGTLLGTVIKIDSGIEHAGNFVKSKLFGKKGNGNFAEGFVSACILFCVGSMTIMGSFESGINGNHDIIFAKSALDFVSSMVYGAAMGIGVTFSVFFILIFQGGLTLLASFISPFLSDTVIVEMSAVGGTILMGLGLNMLGATKEKIKIADMLPSIFLPVAYFAVKNVIFG